MPSALYTVIYGVSEKRKMHQTPLAGFSSKLECSSNCFCQKGTAARMAEMISENKSVKRQAGPSLYCAILSFPQKNILLKNLNMFRSWCRPLFFLEIFLYIEFPGSALPPVHNHKYLKSKIFKILKIFNFQVLLSPPCITIAEEDCQQPIQIRVSIQGMFLYLLLFCIFLYFVFFVCIRYFFCISLEKTGRG